MIRSLSVVIPAKDEARRLPRTLERLESYLRPRVEDLEILVVDDGSRDGTGELARRAGPCVRVVRHDLQRGKGSAVRTGVMAARGEWLLVTDADLAIPIEELHALERATREAPIVAGAKGPQGRSRARRWGAAVGQWLVRVALVGGFRDTQCGLKLFRRDVARRLFAVQTVDGFGYDFEVLYLARRYGIACREVTVRCEDRGDGSVRWTSYVATLVDLARVISRKMLGRYPDRLPD